MDQPGFPIRFAVMMVGEGVEVFAVEHGLELVDNTWFNTEGMYRGRTDREGSLHTAIHADEH